MAAHSIEGSSHLVRAQAKLVRAQTKTEKRKSGHGESIELYTLIFRVRIFGFPYSFQKTKIQYLRYPKIKKISESDPRCF